MKRTMSILLGLTMALSMVSLSAAAGPQDQQQQPQQQEQPTGQKKGKRGKHRRGKGKHRRNKNQQAGGAPTPGAEQSTTPPAAEQPKTPN